MNKKKKKRTLAFVSGGSGGHAYPLFSIAQCLLQEEIVFVGAKRAADEKILQDSSFRCFFISSGKWKGQSFFSLLRAMFLVPISLLESLRCYQKIKPCVVVSSGGYGGAFFFLVSCLMGAKGILLELNTTAGLASKILSRFAYKIYIVSPKVRKSFSFHSHVEEVSYPLRKDIRDLSCKRINHPSSFSSSQKLSLLVVGGSQGARSLNELCFATMILLEAHWGRIHLIHQTGSLDRENMEKKYRTLKDFSHELHSFLDPIALFYERAHIVWTRAGASSLAELRALEKPMVLFPLPSKDQHQEENASPFREKGFLVLPSTQDQASLLARKIEELLMEPSHLGAQSKILASMQQSSGEEKISSAIRAML